jgi:hypothetical protein
VANAQSVALGGPNQVVHPIVGGGLVNGPGNLNPVVAPIGGAAAGGNAIPGNQLGVVDTFEVLAEEATSSDPTQT